jgi:hypothetical protein
MALWCSGINRKDGTNLAKKIYNLQWGPCKRSVIKIEPLKVKLKDKILSAWPEYEIKDRNKVLL